jgi:wyosine [tRNA(Phe)-imidazoG37] synthetase (radical SAM superfamily)
MLLFDDIVFGPVHSRRLGCSLGVNLLPQKRKCCNFDCIYCECGKNLCNTLDTNTFPNREKIYLALESKLQAGTSPDSITFAGNGEPTIHQEFTQIIDDTVFLRNKYSPQSKISVLSNATMLHKKEVVDALMKVDMPILKLDTAIDETFVTMNRPTRSITINQIIEHLYQIGNQCIIQTMFLKGTYYDKIINNTTCEELDAWEKAILKIKPRQVMIYTIARSTAVETISKISIDTLRMIVSRIEKHGLNINFSQ